MKEIISIHVGQAGVQLGNSLWELLCLEHGISESGKMKENPRPVECLDTFFSLSKSNQYVPRTIFVDLEPTVIDEVRNGSYRDLFHPGRLITGPEDAASNFARGFFTVGKLLLGKVSKEIKRLLETAENVQALFIFRSLGGGTGAGLTSAIFDFLVDYPKLVKIEIPIYPSPTLSTGMVEPYNCLLGEHFCMEDIDVGLLMDNEALYDMCSKYLSVADPTYSTINRIISQVASSITASVRFENVMNCDITVLQTNLVPFPRIHFPMANFSPLLSASKAVHEEVSVIDLTRSVFEKENQLMKVDHSFGRFMSCSLFYRGEVSPYHVYLALHAVKRDRSIEFVDWCPTGFKVGINVSTPAVVPASEIHPTSRNLTMLANTSAIGQAWQRLTHKFYLLYSKKSFVHWFIGEGMEECEFTEALYNLSALVKDYEEVTAGTNETETQVQTKEEPQEPQANTGNTEDPREDTEDGQKHLNADEHDIESTWAERSHSSNEVFDNGRVNNSGCSPSGPDDNQNFNFQLASEEILSQYENDNTSENVRTPTGEDELIVG